jgi:hypothetical protein
MPGTPATSPNFDIPRYADTDDAAFSDQVNAITDGFDSQAEKKSNKGSANGYASLDSTGNVPASELGNILTCAVSHPTRVTGTAYQPNTERPTAVNVQIISQAGDAPGTGEAMIGVTDTPSAVVDIVTVTQVDGGNTIQTLHFFVPAGWYYEIAVDAEATIVESSTATTEWAM